MCWRGNKSSPSLGLHPRPAGCLPADHWKGMRECWRRSSHQKQTDRQTRRQTDACRCWPNPATRRSRTRCRAYSQWRCRRRACSRASGRWGRRRDGRCLSACGCTDSLWSGCRSSREPPRSCWPGCRGLAPAGWPGTSERRRGGRGRKWRSSPRAKFCPATCLTAYIFHLEGLLLESFHSQDVLYGDAAKSDLAWTLKEKDPT